MSFGGLTLYYRRILLLEKIRPQRYLVALELKWWRILDFIIVNKRLRPLKLLLIDLRELRSNKAIFMLLSRGAEMSKRTLVVRMQGRSPTKLPDWRATTA